jgi:hypothetical protein
MQDALRNIRSPAPEEFSLHPLHVIPWIRAWLSWAIWYMCTQYGIPTQQLFYIRGYIWTIIGAGSFTASVSITTANGYNDGDEVERIQPEHSEQEPEQEQQQQQQIMEAGAVVAAAEPGVVAAAVEEQGAVRHDEYSNDTGCADVVAAVASVPIRVIEIAMLGSVMGVLAVMITIHQMASDVLCTRIGSAWTGIMLEVVWVLPGMIPSEPRNGATLAMIGTFVPLLAAAVVTMVEDVQLVASMFVVTVVNWEWLFVIPAVSAMERFVRPVAMIATGGALLISGIYAIAVDSVNVPATVYVWHFLGGNTESQQVPLSSMTGATGHVFEFFVCISALVDLLTYTRLSWPTQRTDSRWNDRSVFCGGEMTVWWQQMRCSARLSSMWWASSSIAFQWMLCVVGFVLLAAMKWSAFLGGGGDHVDIFFTLLALFVLGLRACTLPDLHKGLTAGPKWTACIPIVLDNYPVRVYVPNRSDEQEGRPLSIHAISDAIRNGHS